MTAADPLGSLLAKVANGYVPTSVDIVLLPLNPAARPRVVATIARTVRTVGALRAAARYADAKRLCRGVSVDLRCHLVVPRSDAR